MSGGPILAERLDQALESALHERRIVGAVLLVARGGQLSYSRAVGLADREASAAMHTDAVFRLSSLTKPIVAAAAMVLVERGRLGLTDPVTRWLLRFRPRLADGREPPITLHHLLTHSAGLDYRFNQPDGEAYHQLGVSDGLDQPGLALSANLERLAQAPLVFAPGGGWRYSLSMDVLGAIISQATDADLEVAVQALVTGPLGMTHTRFRPQPGTVLVTPYADGSPEPRRMDAEEALPLWGGAVRFAPDRAFDPASYSSGGAGMIGSAPDFLHFLETLRTGGGPILKPETVRQMMSLQIGPEPPSQGPGWGFGYGWSVLADPALAQTPQSAGTIQWGGVYGHNWFIDPARGLSVALLTNTSFEGMIGGITTDVRDAIYAG